MTRQEIITEWKQWLSSHQEEVKARTLTEIPDDTPEDDVWDEIYEEQFGGNMTNEEKMLDAFIETYKDVAKDSRYEFSGEQLHLLCNLISTLLQNAK